MAKRYTATKYHRVIACNTVGCENCRTDNVGKTFYCLGTPGRRVLPRGGTKITDWCPLPDWDEKGDANGRTDVSESNRKHTQ